MGETCVDEYVYGECLRLSPEAPVPVMLHAETEKRFGMARNVVNNLSVFPNVDITLITQKEEIRKVRFVDKTFHHQILRVDFNDTVKPINSSNIQNHKNRYDCIIISDYNKGYLSPTDIVDISSYGYENNCPVFIDTKKKTIPMSFLAPTHRGYWPIFKVNESEFKALGSKPRHDRTIITRGALGADFNGVNYPAENIGVFDVCGAGDTFLAALAYKYLLSGSIEKSIPFANKAAAIAVSHFGTYVLTKEDVDAICN